MTGAPSSRSVSSETQPRRLCWAVVPGGRTWSSRPGSSRRRACASAPSFAPRAASRSRPGSAVLVAPARADHAGGLDDTQARTSGRRMCSIVLRDLFRADADRGRLGQYPHARRGQQVMGGLFVSRSGAVGRSGQRLTVLFRRPHRRGLIDNISRGRLAGRRRAIRWNRRLLARCGRRASGRAVLEGDQCAGPPLKTPIDPTAWRLTQPVGSTEPRSSISAVRWMRPWRCGRFRYGEARRSSIVRPSWKPTRPASRCIPSVPGFRATTGSTPRTFSRTWPETASAAPLTSTRTTGQRDGLARSAN